MKNITTIALIFAAFLVAAPLEGFAEEYDYGSMSQPSKISFNLFEEKDSYLDEYGDKSENSSDEPVFAFPSEIKANTEIGSEHN